MIINEKRYPVLIWGIIIVVLAWEAHVFSVFSLINGVAYDVFVRLSFRNETSDQLLVLDGNKSYAEQGDEVWMPLLKNLLASQAKQVVFNFLPEHVSNNFYRTASDSGKVIFGRHVEMSDPYASVKLEPIPHVAENIDIITGVITIPTPENGVFRKQLKRITTGESTLSSLEQAAVDKSTAAINSDGNSLDYLVNFVGGSVRIPKMQLEQAVSGNLIGELLAGRTVLVGLYGVEPLSKYVTPLSKGDGLMPDVLFHAFAMDTLLSRRSISVPSETVMLTAFAAVCAITLFYCQYLSFHQAFILSMAMSLSYGLISWLGLQLFFLWIRPFELILTQWLCIALAWRYRIIEEQIIVDKTLASLSGDLQEKFVPKDFNENDDDWLQIVDMINQSLHLSRMLFFGLVEGDHRIKVACAFKCSADDVDESRRDYKRTPYSTAIQENKPQLQERPFLKPRHNEEIQYLVPLVFAGEILGFWAFSTEPETIKSTEKFHALIQAYMYQISEFLYGKQAQEKQHTRESNRLLAYLNYQSVISPYQKLNSSVAILNKRATQLQQVFNTLNTGGILYDLFGRVLLLNKHMEELAQSVNLKLYNMTALELVVTVTGMDENKARSLIRKTIFDLESASIPVSNFKSNRDYLFHIQPLKLQEHEYGGLDTKAVLPIVGILCELEDITDLKIIYRLKEDLFSRLHHQLQDTFSSVLSALPEIENTGISREEMKRLLTGIRSNIDTSLSTLNLVHDQMNNEIGHLVSNIGCYPINALKTIDKAIDALTEYADERFIDVRLQSPESLNLVIASPKELYQIIYAVLQAMIDDTFDGTDVFIIVEEKKESIQYFFSNRGIGLINNKIGHSDTDMFPDLVEGLNFNKFKQYVSHWEGELELSSQMGEGSQIVLTLKRFL
ncbi:MAG: CHASE2 domain-containing protein [Methylococcaceae bacterium]|nr:CHASE2 domain-containing protein [Methylococcaceae bacterium]